MRLLLLFVVMSCVSWSGLPQDSSKTQEDTINLNVGNSNVQIPIISDSILEYERFKKTIAVSKKNNKPEQLARAYVDLAIWHENHTVLDSSIANLKKAIAVYKKQGLEKELAETYLLLKANYGSTAAYDKASEAVYAALDLYEKIKDRKGIAKCYTSIGDLFYYSNRYSEGAEYCKKAIAIQKENGFEEDLALSYRRLAENQLFLSSLEESLKNMNKAINTYKKIGETGAPLLACYNGRGNIYKYLEEYDKAIADYNYCYEGAKKIGLEQYMMPPTANIGHVYILQGNYAEALPYNLKAIEIMKRTGNTKNLWENYMHVSNIYRQLGDYKNALEYHELYEQGHAEYLTTITSRIESEAHVKYETAKKTIEIGAQKAKIEHQKRIQILYVSIAVLLAIILSGMFFTIKNIRKKRKALAKANQELDAKNKQNELLLKETHHRVKNNLGAIEMKDYFINLSEGVLDTFNAEDKVKIECAMEELNLDVDTAVPIGLIVNELLTNALKYAFPKGSEGTINISLKEENNDLKLQVSDNGIGKTAGTAPKGTGFGTQLIRLLTQQLDGSLFEEHKKGTSVFFTFKNYKTA